MKQYLLCTDLDRTLIPNGTQPASSDAMERFKHLVSRDEVKLAYVTGRHRELVEQAITEYGLPEPDFVIADVGATIYRAGASGWTRCEDWDARVAADWRNVTHGELYLLLSVFFALRLQEKEKQNRHKLSFYVSLDMDTQALIRDIEARLTQAGVKANLIWSIDKQSGWGFLDVLPASANKLHAIQYLMRREGYGRDNTLFAGDSGNDLDVMVGGMLSVMVANADEELKKRVSVAKKGEPNDTLYVAEGGYLGMNGNYSAGILEGVAYHWPEADRWLREMT